MAETLVVRSLRELDYRVAQHVFGWRVEEGKPEPHHAGRLIAWPPDDGGKSSSLEWGRGGKPLTESFPLYGVRSDLPRYSRSIAAAWDVVERLREEGEQVQVVSGSTALVVVFTGHVPATSRVSQDSVPLLICLAALSSRGVTVDLRLEESDG